MKARIAKINLQRKKKIQKRLAKTTLSENLGPMLNPGNIQYDMDHRSRGK